VDIGGTYTNVALVDKASGRIGLPPLEPPVPIKGQAVAFSAVIGTFSGGGVFRLPAFALGAGALVGFDL
jgi:hypothetical protein